MAIINRRNDNTSEVLLNIFDQRKMLNENKIKISFHKKIHGAVNLADSRSITKINLAIEEISELIY
jgi:hypothetical protein